MTFIHNQGLIHKLISACQQSSNHDVKIFLIFGKTKLIFKYKHYDILFVMYIMCKHDFCQVL